MRLARRMECGWINAELDFMEVTLEGCDWCCGGGDEIQAYLLHRLAQLGGKREFWDRLFREEEQDFSTVALATPFRIP